MRREQRTTTKSNPIAGRPSPCSSPHTVATTTRADSLEVEKDSFLQPLFRVPIWLEEYHMEEPRQPLIQFEPVPLRHRNDGWTVEKQYARALLPSLAGRGWGWVRAP